LESVLFYFLAAVSILTALVVAVSRRPTYGALALIVCFCAVAGLYALLGATFLAAVQIIVYAGAVLVVFLLVIMLLDLRGETSFKERHGALRWAALPVGIMLMTLLGTVIARSPQYPQASTGEPVKGTAAAMGAFLFTDYLAPFEATAILILVALVGATWLAKR
jgi:NADH-quinone oxidoreductase subunit J